MSRSNPKSSEITKSQKPDLANRSWLVGAYRQRVIDANDILTNLSPSEQQMMKSKYGGLLSDKTIMTNKGTFRSQATKLRNEELNEMISLLDSFIDNYNIIFEESEKVADFANRVGVDEDDLAKIYTFMDYAKNRVTESALDSHQIRDIAENRFKSGEGFMEVVRAFEQAIDNSIEHGDPDEFFTLFSENGRLL